MVFSEQNFTEGHRRFEHGLRGRIKS